MKNLESGEIEFLRAEVLTGLTFAKIALGARHQDKIDRNRVNAKKAYDTLLRFMPHDDATSGAWDDVRAKIAELRSQLQQLGEKV
jgi:hypothetical protein